MASNSYFYGLGRRKSATARVRLLKGKGNIVVNGHPVEEYVSNSKYLMSKLAEPFGALDIPNDFDISVVVSGGGINAQIEAIRLGISKCLTLLNEDYKQTLKRADLLGRDSRDKERKKFGLRGARKQRQFTKR
jgi:small subunit ribosomal protein S9